MTKEEVSETVTYCEENKVSYKQRLGELGISEWTFFSSKRRYAPKQNGEDASESLPLMLGDVFLPYPIEPFILTTLRERGDGKNALLLRGSALMSRFAFGRRGLRMAEEIMGRIVWR